MWDDLIEWDRTTLIYLNGLGHTSYDAFWSMVTEIYTWVPLFIFFIILLYKYNTRQEATAKMLLVIILAVLVGLVTHWTKISISRIRPNNDMEINTVIRVLKNPSDFSFFSGHASSSFSISVLVFLLLRKNWKWAFLFFIWPVLFCISRIYVGVHYPLDVIVGALVGTTFGFLFYRIFEMWSKMKTI